MKKYRSQLAVSRSWKEIEKDYRELIEEGMKIKPMIELLRYINQTNLDKRLFAYTSMHKLIIGIYKKIEWNREALHIEFDIEVRKWFFKYYSKPNEPIAFERTYDEKIGIEKFEQFIKNAKW